MSKLGKDIIQYLENETNINLPEYGVIAGQSVAEAYFRIKNIPIYTRIKDIDLFVDINKNKDMKKHDNVTRNYLNLNLFEKQQQISTKIQKKEKSFDSFEGPQETIKSYNFTYRITDTFNIGIINFVEVQIYYKIGTKFSKIIIDNFDFNSVKIAVDMKTKQVFISNDFKEFLKTKQVEIVKSTKPVVSLCRFLEKSQYYKGCYFNFNYEINKLLPYFFLYKRNKKEPEKNQVMTLKDRYEKLSDENKKLLKRFFTIENSGFEVFDIIKIPLSYINSYYPDCYDKDIKKILYNDKNIIFITPEINYFKHNTKSIGIASLIEDESLLYQNTLKDLYQYYKNKKDNKITPKMRDFLLNKKEYIKKELSEERIIFDYNLPRDVKEEDVCIVLTSKEIETVSFSLNIKNFNSIYKKNIRNIFPKFNKYINNNNLVEYKEFNSLFYSKNKIELILKDLSKNNNQGYFNLFKLFLNNNINLLSFLYIKDNYKKALLRHFRLVDLIIKKNVIEKKSDKIDFELIAQKIIEIEKSRYPFIIGEIETQQLDLDFLFKDKYELEEYVMNEEKNENKSVAKLNDEILTFKDYKIRHINNAIQLKNVGYEMKHCVGGYSRLLLKQNQIFFDIYDKDNIRYTLSVRKDRNHKKLILSEFKRKMNVYPDNEIVNDMIEFVDQLNKNIPLIPA